MDNHNFSQFRATQFWNEMVSDFRNRVPYRKLRTRCINCFSGKDAVDVLHQCLIENQYKITREVTRDKAKMLCDSWLRSKILIPVLEGNEIIDHVNNKVPNAVEFSETFMYRLVHEKEQEIETERPVRLFYSPNHPSVRLTNIKKRRYRGTPDAIRRKEFRSGILSLDGSTIPTTPLKNLTFSPGGARRKHIRSVQFLAVPDASNNENEVFMDLRPSSSPRETFLNVFRSLSPCRRPNTNKYDQIGSTQSSSDSSDSGSNFSNSVVDLSNIDEKELEETDHALIHEAALFRLLTLVDIPVLDGILQFQHKYIDPEKDPVALAYNQNPTVLDGLMAKISLKQNKKRIPWSEAVAYLGLNHSNDPWVNSSVSCLPQFWSNDFVREVKEYSPESMQFRLFLFNKVCENYRDLSSDGNNALIPEVYDQLACAIFDQLLAKQRYSCAIEACQLLLVMLPNYRRRPLCALLQYLDVVQTNEKKTKLNKDSSNIDFSLNVVEQYVIRSNELPAPHLHQLLEFMVSNCSKVVVWPEELKIDLWKRLKRPNSDSDDPAEPGVNFCANRTTSADYSSHDTTEVNLVQMVNQVVDSTTLSLDFKKDYILDFQAAHPKTYEKHFENLKY